MLLSNGSMTRDLQGFAYLYSKGIAHRVSLFYCTFSPQLHSHRFWQDFGIWEFMTNISLGTVPTANVTPSNRIRPPLFRTLVPIKYYIIDFELSYRAPPDADLGDKTVSGSPSARYGTAIQTSWIMPRPFHQSPSRESPTVPLSRTCTSWGSCCSGGW